MSNPASVEPAEHARRVRAVFSTLLVALLPWLIAPGKVQPDTKLDLTVSPWLYLSRALEAWNSHAGLGELQNQAYGYLLPLGPIMALADSLTFSDWAAQRVWWSVLLVTAFGGTYFVARRVVGLSSDLALVAAALYALAPRVLSVLSQISVEAWPGALAPWFVLVAWSMVRPGTSTAQLVRAAAITSLLTISLGGVNATASAVVLGLPFFLLLTAPRSARPIRAVAFWLAAVVLGAAWWLIPLFVLAQFGYPFLDFIETARITTAVTSVPNVLRGADHWIAYILDSQSHPIWQAGWVQAQGLVAILTSTLIAGAAVAGLILLSRDPSKRHVARFAVLSAVFGVALMVLGHGQVAGSLVAEPVRAFLDGAGAALRNVHKADPLVRLPFALGVAYLLSQLRLSPRRAVRLGAVVVLVAALLSPMSLWAGRAGDANSYRQIPRSWTLAADQIDQLADQNGGSTLVLPAARTAEFGWGKTSDEPLSALAKSPIVVRAAAPLGHPGATRLLDAIDDAVATGATQPGLAQTLRRMGVARVVVRHGVLSLVQARPAEQVERTLAASTGFTRLQRFGDLTLWQVGDGKVEPVSIYSADKLTVAGGPEALLDLADQSLTASQAVTVQPGAELADVLTDSLRWRQFNSGRPTQLAYGPTLTAADTSALVIGSKDLPPAGEVQNQPVREWIGLADVQVSSSGSDPFARHFSGAAAGPAAAIDQDPATAWLTDEAKTGWLKLKYVEQTKLGTLTLTQAPGSTELAHVDLVVKSGKTSSRRQVKFNAGQAKLDLGEQPVSELKVVLPKANRELVRGLAEISSSAHQMGSRIALAGSVDLSSGQVLLSPLAEDPISPNWTFDSAAAADAAVGLRVRANPGERLNDLLDAPVQFQSDLATTSAKDRPGASFDADPETAWQVPAGVRSATVTVDFEKPTEFGKLSGAGTGLTAITVSAGGRTAKLSPSGGTLDLKSEQFVLQFYAKDASKSWQVPQFDWTAIEAKPAEVELACMTITIGGRQVRFGGPVSRDSLAAGAPIDLAACGDSKVKVAKSTVEVRTSMAEQVRIDQLTIGQGAPSTQVTREVRSGRLVGGQVEAKVGPGEEAVIALAQSANQGWRARTSDGKQLESLVVDGWRQGFVVPATAAATTIEIYFGPTTAQRAGLLAGPVVALVAFALLFWTRKSKLSWQLAEPETIHRRQWLGGAVCVLVGFAAGGVFGAALAVAAGSVPRRFLAPAALLTMTGVGVAMATLGVVDQGSSGAVLGQLGGLFTVSLLLRGLFDTAPTSSSDVQAAATTGSQLPG